MKIRFPLVVSHCAAIALGVALAMSKNAKAPSSSKTTFAEATPESLRQNETPSPSPVETGGVERREGGNFSSQNFQWAYSRLAEGKLTGAERHAIRVRLFTEWAKVDLKAALAAALAEPWDQISDYNGFNENFVRDVFGKVFVNDPKGSWEVLQSGDLGVGASRIRGDWYELVGRKNPVFVAERLRELTPRDREILLRTLTGSSGAPEVLKALLAMPPELVPIERIFQNSKLPSMVESEKSLEGITDFESRESRLALMNYGANLKEEISKLPADSPQLVSFSEKVAQFPSEIQGELLHGMLNDFNVDTRRVRKLGLDKTTFLIDQLVAGEHWEYLQKSSTMMQFRGGTERMVDEDRAAWATELPVRAETKPLFEAGVADYIKNNPDLAWEWIQEFPEDHWRDEALSIYAREAQRAGRDEDAQRAHELIQSP
ncbi:MAG: hypothetical protein ACSHYB_17310 [Roseibacillus sp.]